MMLLKHSAALACASLALLLGACSNNDDSGTPPSARSTLTVTLVGPGRVVSNPAGIDCGATCSASFDNGTPVTLTAQPSPGSVFVGWSGPGAGTTCTTNPVCSGNVTSDVGITATFRSSTTGAIVAVTSTGKLISFSRNGSDVGPETSSTIQGLQAGEAIVGIDFQPSTDRLYGLSNQARVYQLDPSSGSASSPVQLTASGAPVVLAGGNFGVDFNPTSNRLRVVSASGQNLAIDVATGATTVDPALNGNGTRATAAAYSNNFPGATATALFVVDDATDALYVQNPPPSGTLTRIGALGIDIDGLNGFEIIGSGTVPNSQEALAAFTIAGGGPRLYTIDLSSGLATTIASIETGDNGVVIGLSVRPQGTQGVLGDTSALLSSNRLVTFNRSNPGVTTTRAPVAGLPAGAQVVGIDVRPKDQKLYALSKNGPNGALHVIDPATGLVTSTTPLIDDPADASTFSGLSGITFGVDFDPIADTRPPVGPSLRVVTSSGQQYQVNADTGETRVLDPLNKCNTSAVELEQATASAIAFSNSFGGTRSSSLYMIDPVSDTLTVFDTDLECILIADDGTMIDVGALGQDFDGSGGFEIDAYNNKAYAVLKSGSALGFYQINLGTGAAVELGDLDGATGIPGTETVIGMALRQPAPVVAYGLTIPADGFNHLLAFDPNDTATIARDTVISLNGQPLTERLLSIDFRPQDCSRANGCALFGVGELLGVYRINPATGAATVLSQMRGALDDASDVFTTFRGTELGMEFDPLTPIGSEHLKMVSNAASGGEYLQLDPATGFTRTNPRLSRATPQDGFNPAPGYPCDVNPSTEAVAMAQTNSFRGSTSTTAYVIGETDSCVKRLDPATGKLFPIGAITASGMTAAMDGRSGFDIVGGANGLIVAAVRRQVGQPPTAALTVQSQLCSISLGRAASNSPNATRASACTDIGAAGAPVLRGLALLLVPADND